MKKDGDVFRKLHNVAVQVCLKGTLQKVTLYDRTLHLCYGLNEDAGTTMKDYEMESQAFAQLASTCPNS